MQQQANEQHHASSILSHLVKPVIPGLSDKQSVCCQLNPQGRCHCYRGVSESKAVQHADAACNAMQCSIAEGKAVLCIPLQTLQQDLTLMEAAAFASALQHP